MVTEFGDRGGVVTNEIDARTDDDQLPSISGINYHNCIRIPLSSACTLCKFNNMVYIALATNLSSLSMNSHAECETFLLIKY